jgi:RsiW-degrading membrane proteinase PrsW (M82 family)
MLLAIASLVAAVVPMFTYLIVIWLLDRYDREPFWMVLLTFMWGATGAIFLGIIGSIIFQVPVSTLIIMVSDGNIDELTNLAGSVITAPVVEEATKGIFLLFVSMSKKFDSGVDGAVYGGAVGLGFGMTENFMYFVNFGNTPENWIMLVLIRTLFSAVMHCLAQATFGSFIGFAKFKPAILKFILIPTGYCLAVFMHFTWNLSVSFNETSLIGFVFLILSFFTLLAIFQISVYFEGRSILKELQEESRLGTIPQDHLNYLPFITKRYKYGWCPAGVNQKEYVKTATTLAIRRRQIKYLKGTNRLSYQRDVDGLRYKIQKMMYDASLLYHKSQASYSQS